MVTACLLWSSHCLRPPTVAGLRVTVTQTLVTTTPSPVDSIKSSTQWTGLVRVAYVSSMDVTTSLGRRLMLLSILSAWQTMSPYSVSNVIHSSLSLCLFVCLSLCVLCICVSVTESLSICLSQFVCPRVISIVSFNDNDWYDTDNTARLFTYARPPCVRLSYDMSGAKIVFIKLGVPTTVVNLYVNLWQTLTCWWRNVPSDTAKPFQCIVFSSSDTSA